MARDTDSAPAPHPGASPGEAGADPRSRESADPRRHVRVIAVLAAAAAAVYLGDQLSKNWVETNLTEGTSVPVIGELLQWHFVRNPGAAFSFASGSTWIFTILATVVVAVILWQIRRLASVPWALFLGLLLGGVLGNLTDRLTRTPGFPVGHVVDFILTPWMWLGFPPAIYNVADVGIVVGMGIFIVISLLGVPIDGSARRAAADSDAAETDIERPDEGDLRSGEAVSGARDTERDGTP